MIKLFKYEGYKLNISEEALLLKPFKEIWQRDKSKNKDKALQELGYIYFMLDPRSDYMYITDNEERSKAIIEGEGLPNTWKVDSTLQEAMDYYKSFRPTSALLLEDTRIAVDKLREALRSINLTDVDDKGRPIYTLNTIVATIKQVPALVKDLDDAERAIAKEIVQNDKIRGSAEKSMYEDLNL